MQGHLLEHQRHRILSVMRWTVWLSAFAIPFSVSVPVCRSIFCLPKLSKFLIFDLKAIRGSADSVRPQ
jgi:hypothetical protein